MSTSPTRTVSPADRVSGPVGCEAAAPRRRFGGRFWPAVAAMAVVGCVLALPRFRLGLSVDEPFSAGVAGLPWSQVLAVLHHDLTPAYYVLLRGWYLALGDGETALRALSLLCYFTTIIIVAASARQVSGDVAGLAAAGLASTSVVAQRFAATVRQYALLGLCVALATLVWVWAAGGATPPSARPRRGALTTLGVMAAVNTLGLLVHPLFAFYIVGCCAGALILQRRLLRLGIAAAALSLALYLLLVGRFVAGGTELQATSWIPRPGTADLVIAFGDALWGRLGAVVVLLSLAVGMVRTPSETLSVVRDRRLLWLLATVGCACLVPYVLSRWVPVFLAGRIAIVFLPPLCVAAALLLARLLRRWAMVPIALLVAASVVSARAEMVRPDQVSYRPTLTCIARAARCGDTVVLGALSYSSGQYYLHRLALPECVAVISFPASTASHPGWLDVPSLMADRPALDEEARLVVEAARGTPSARIWVTGAYGGSYGAEVTSVLVKQLDRVMTPEVVPGIDACPWESLPVYSVGSAAPAD